MPINERFIKLGLFMALFRALVLLKETLPRIFFFFSVYEAPPPHSSFFPGQYFGFMPIAGCTESFAGDGPNRDVLHREPY